MCLVYTCHMQIKGVGSLFFLTEMNNTLKKIHKPFILFPL
jgi:hypothetical protein